MSNEQIADLRRKADQGDPEAQFGLGLAYSLGHGVPQDYAKARQWYEKAAAQGYTDAHVGLKMLADQGDPEAQFGLGLVYANGLYGVPQDFVKARQWYERAAAQGNGMA